MADPGLTLPPVHRREELARAWTRSATTASYIPRAADDIEALLLELVDALLAALGADTFTSRAGNDIGERLVREGFIDPAALSATIDVLSRELLGGLPATPDNELARRATALLGALSAGYVDGLRSYTLTQQEEVKQALFNAVLRAEHNLRGTENRFREVFASSATGIAITDLDTLCVEANPALGAIVGVEPDKLTGRRLTDVFTHEEAPNVMSSYRSILEDGQPRVHEHRKVRTADGEDAWVLLAISLLRDGAGEPAYFVTMVQDTTELHLLQRRLEHQLLYDAMTGLPNRQYFHTQLESTLERAGEHTPVTLCCLNLDGFALVNNSYGQAVGDRLLHEIGRRLREAGEAAGAVVARTGGDEFAVLFADSPDPQDLGELIRGLTADLEDPVYIGGVGVAVGASVGAARSTSCDASELFQAADIALRKAKRMGRRQWAEFHESDDRPAMDLARLATSMPAAWENGELTVDLVPVIRLSDRKPVGARAVLAWAEADPRTCADLAERTGWSVHIGPELLAQACRRFAGSDGVLRVALTRDQSGDADLVGAVQRAVKESGLPPLSLEVALDVGAVLADHGDARDNLEVLGDIVRAGLWRVTGGPLELDLIATSGVRSVTLSDALGPGGLVLAEETTRTVARLAELDVACSVLGTGDLEWWSAIGVATAQGGDPDSR